MNNEALKVITGLTRKQYVNRRRCTEERVLIGNWERNRDRKRRKRQNTYKRQGWCI